MRADVLRQLAPRLGKGLALTKDVPPPQRAADAVKALDLDGFAVLIDPTTEALEAVARFGAVKAAQQLKLAVPEADDFALPNEPVVAFASTRAAELVGKRILDDGTIVDNPRPEYAITDGTRQMLQVTLTRAFTEEWTVADLERTLRDSYAFSSNRAALIARTEIGNALVEGNMATWRESGLVTGKQSILGSEHDEKAECMCAENAAAGAIDMDEPFPSGDMAPLYHPACVAAGTIVAAPGVSAHFARRYEGEVVVVRAAGVEELTLTPNHPVLTPRGWVPAGELRESDRLVYAAQPGTAVAVVAPDDHQMPARIEDVAGALRVAGEVSTRLVPLTPEAFHGDGAIDGEVEIVRPARLLVDDREAARGQGLVDELLVCARCGRVRRTPEGAGAQLVEGGAGAADGGVRGLGARLADGGALAGGLDDVRLAAGADAEAGALEDLAQGAAVAADPAGDVDGGLASEVGRVERGDVGVGEAAALDGDVARPAVGEPRLLKEALHYLAGDAEDASQVSEGLAAQVTLVQIAELRRGHYDGHVFNLATGTGWYFAQGILVHNCVCDVEPVLADDAEASA